MIATEDFVASDVAILDLLRKSETASVLQLALACEVTSTAIRQRLSRLLAQGLITRTLIRSPGRGRPTHSYSLTDAGRRKTGENFADLAVALWHEIRSIQDAEVRRGLLQRISKRLAALYAEEVLGETTGDRMAMVAEIFSDRRMPFEVDRQGQLPVLHALACPYPGLADQDRSVCAMERMLFSELVGSNLRLSHCRLDGDSCCTFELS